jgi:hypothetical protein
MLENLSLPAGNDCIRHQLDWRFNEGEKLFIAHVR